MSEKVARNQRTQRVFEAELDQRLGPKNPISPEDAVGKVDRGYGCVLVRFIKHKDKTERTHSNQVEKSGIFVFETREIDGTVREREFYESMMSTRWLLDPGKPETDRALEAARKRVESLESLSANPYQSVGSLQHHVNCTSRNITD